MLQLASQARLFFCMLPINMHKSFEGLSAMIERMFPGELFTSGAYFVCLNRKRDQIKVLYWDADGLAIWHKRLEKGSFIPRNQSNSLLNRREFFMLLEGITPQRVQKRFSL